MRFIISILFIFSCLAGCSTIDIPGAKPINTKDACGALAKRKCAPSVGTALPFTKQYKTIPISREEKLVALDYLGTIVSLNNRRGEPGAICGNDKISPFEVSHINEATYGNKIELKVTRNSTLNSEIRADVTRALLEAQVSEEITNRIVANVSTTINNSTDSIVNTTATLKEYQLSHAALKELEWAIGKNNTDSNFQRCAQELAQMQSNWRIYQAISILQIDSLNLESNRISDIKGNLDAAINSELSKARNENPTEFEDQEIASITADISRRVETSLQTATQPYLVVIGASFWHSPRYSGINNDQIIER